MTFTLRWGIIGCGGISATFVRDLLLDPELSRGTVDVRHRVVAVAARDASRADAFVQNVMHGQQGVRTYGDYQALCEDEGVDCVYIGTTHVHHFEQAKQALLAGKHVLIEKPITTTAADARALVALAQAQDRFLMEAVWTRFQPMVCEVIDKVRGGLLGRVTRVVADLAFYNDLTSCSRDSRIIAPELAGGALLDLGTYPHLWPLLVLPSSAAASFPRTIAAGMQLTSRADLPEAHQVDAQTAWVCSWTREGEAPLQAILSVSLQADTPPQQGVLIQGVLGHISIAHPNFRPESYTVHLSSSPGEGEVFRAEDFRGARGMHWMADSVARSIRDGERECEGMRWGESVAQMEAFDEVRRQGGYVLLAEAEGR